MATVNETQLQWSCKCRKKAPQTRPTSDKVREKCQKLILSEEALRQVTNLFMEELKKGLTRKTHDTATVKCYLTYVQDLPKGNEKGQFLALDFGSADLRLLLCEITDNGVNLKSKTYRIPEYTLFSTGAQLFDNIVDHLVKFMREEKVSRQKMFLALTFGFPLKQTGLQKGVLIKWTKGFKCSNVVGNDVVQLLRDAIERKGDVDVEVCAILNDTTGTLISCAYDHHHCKIGVVICEGSNACYIEKQKNVEIFDDEDHGSGTVLINTEWGAFGDNGVLKFISTDFDKEIDESSNNPGKQTFEKMISGIYMGELVRHVMVHFTRDGYLFNGKGSTELYTSETFPSTYIYNIESDPPETYTNCKKALGAIGLQHATNNDCANVRFICECVSRRSGQLVAAALAALIHKVNESAVTIGINGSVYNKHPHYHYILVTTLEKLVKHGLRYEVVGAEDGSGRGAALLAAAVSEHIVSE